MVCDRYARRRILHFDVTNQPTAVWVIQQLRETFAFDVVQRHLIFDRDSIFSAQGVATVKSFGIEPARTAYRSPWQNGIAERWSAASVGSYSTGSSSSASVISDVCFATTCPTPTTTGRTSDSTNRRQPAGRP
jgi:hypothetical protein